MARLKKLKGIVVLVLAALVIVPGCAENDDDSSGGGGGTCSSDDKLPCVENYNSCSDSCGGDMDCLCSCGQAEYNCLLSAGCTEEQAESQSHVGVCDW